MKIAVLSDTHGLLRPEVLAVLRECDAVIHAGDVDSRAAFEEMEKAKRPESPLFAVRGNCDGEWAAQLPLYLAFTLGGWKFYVTHKKKDVPEELGDRQIVVTGHSHKYSRKQKDGRLWLNPGSCGRRRFREDVTMAVLCLEKEKWTAERLDFTDRAKMPEPGRSGSLTEEPEHLLPVIRQILRKMDKGQQVSRIAADLKLEETFVAQICRIRVTHPGVTAQGILDKVEVNRAGRNF